MPRITVTELAAKVGGTIHGDPSISISSLGPLENAGTGCVTFFAPKSKRDTARLSQLLTNSTAAAAFVSEPQNDFRGTQILVKNPYLAAVIAARIFAPAPRPQPGIHPTAVIDPTATLGEGVYVGAYAVIGARVTIGRDAVIHPHVVIYEGAEIGAESVIHSSAVIREYSRLGVDCLIQPGAVIGGDGFGYIPDREKGHERIPHIGVTVLEDRVDVGANSTIDRATFGETRVKRSAKIDNLVMIGHNCAVGARTFLCSLVGLSGSTTVGDDCVLAGQAGVADHLVIGNRVRVAAKAGVVNDVPDGIDISGMPHQEAKSWRREQAALRKLPELLQKLRPILKEQSAKNQSDRERES